LLLLHVLLRDARVRKPAADLCRGMGLHLDEGGGSTARLGTAARRTMLRLLLEPLSTASDQQLWQDWAHARHDAASGVAEARDDAPLLALRRPSDDHEFVASWWVAEAAKRGRHAGDSDELRLVRLCIATIVSRAPYAAEAPVGQLAARAGARVQQVLDDMAQLDARAAWEVAEVAHDRRTLVEAAGQLASVSEELQRALAQAVETTTKHDEP
jgi:hypothetical protein